MPFIQAIALGITQGLTEFLPISSDGHLWIVYQLFHKAPDLTFEIFLHFATLLVLVVYFWRDIVDLATSLLPSRSAEKGKRRLVLLIVIGTGVSGAIALAMGNAVDAANKSAVAVGLGFLATTALLVAAELVAPRVKRIAEAEQLPVWRAVPIGILQALAVLPGVSRSGSTISAGMFFGLDREQAARFSFLLGIPIIALATAKDALDVFGGTASLPPVAVSAAGFVAAAVAGYFAIWGLLAFVKRHSLLWFAAYTGVVGAAILVISVLSRG